MSHPVPGHDYSEQHNRETNAEYAKRRRAGLAKFSHTHIAAKGQALKNKILKGHKGHPKRTAEEKGEADSDFDRGN